jgi:hypothetical protein
MNESSLPSYLWGDLPSWIAVALTLCAVTIAVIAVRRSKSRLALEKWLKVDYDDMTHDIRVAVRAVVVPQSLSFLWKTPVCELMVGSEKFDIPSESIISFQPLDHTYVLEFKSSNDKFPTDVSGARLRVTAALKDGGHISNEWTMKFESGRPMAS